MVLVRDRRWLPLTFKETSEVLKDVQSEGEEINFMYQGIQLTRQFRALKLWMSFKVFGLDAISQAIAAASKTRRWRKSCCETPAAGKS